MPQIGGGGSEKKQKSLKFKKSKTSDGGQGGGGQAYFGKTPKFSRFLIMIPPLICFEHPVMSLL